MNNCITRFLKRHQMTQPQMAEYFGLSKSYINKAANDKCKVIKTTKMAMILEDVKDEFSWAAGLNKYIEKRLREK